jgi:hypothetical protein
MPDHVLTPYADAGKRRDGGAGAGQEEIRAEAHRIAPSMSYDPIV